MFLVVCGLAPEVENVDDPIICAELNLLALIELGCWKVVMVLANGVVVSNFHYNQINIHQNIAQYKALK